MAVERAILESFSTPLLAADRGGRVRMANPAAAHFWKQQPERMTEFTVSQLFGAGSVVATQLERALREETSCTIDQFRFAQGEGLPPLFLRVQIDPVMESNTPADFALIAFWDETLRERQTLMDQERRTMDSIGLMVRRLAHELQNPLSGVKGATQLLSRHLKESPDLQEYSTVILRELDRLERLVRSLLVQGGVQPLQPTLFNLHELLDSVIWFHNNAGTGITVTRDYDPSLPDITADRDRLHQVFLNLLQNAAEASPPGSTVTVRTRILGPWHAWESLPERTGVHFLIEVEDEGVGVAPDDLPRLFTPLFTTKKTGHGLGLSICYQIVRAHKGLIRYRSSRSGGAVFSVLMPLDESQNRRVG
jgi:two-component system, NtrC family, nitrogen regulation sensor histidine kinase GlnL